MSNIAHVWLLREAVVSVELMAVVASACGHPHLNQFNQNDITAWKKEMAELTGIQLAGANSVLK